jgi:ribosomal protein L20A (L18A)
MKLRMEETQLAGKVQRLYEELHLKGLRYRPHCWLSEEWFSPDGVPGIAIPFYLGHPRLTKLEYRQMFEVEGGTDRWCMRLLRHEAGHAYDTAYRLHARKRWKQLFGDFHKPYPDHYRPRPGSDRYVLHLDWWYAQSHPAEDFAETFAVWLRPRSNWKKAYRGWPALKKLEYVDELMHSLAGRSPLSRSRRKVEPLSRIKKTLREYYAEKRATYGIAVSKLYDRDLMRLFPDNPDARGKHKTAAAFLKRAGPELCRAAAKGTGQQPYVVAQILQEVIVRCRELNLRVTRPEEAVKLDTVVFLSVQTLNHFTNVHYKIPM